jgi:hypothetical protein
MKIWIFIVIALTIVSIGVVSAGIDANFVSGGGSTQPQVACETIAWGDGRRTGNGYLPYSGSMAYSDSNNQNYRAGYEGWISGFKGYTYLISGGFFGTPSCQLRINGTTVTNGTIPLQLLIFTTSNGFVNYDKNAVTFGEQDRITAFWDHAGASATVGVGCQVVMCREI